MPFSFDRSQRDGFSCDDPWPLAGIVVILRPEYQNQRPKQHETIAIHTLRGTARRAAGQRLQEGRESVRQSQQQGSQHRRLHTQQDGGEYAAVHRHPRHEPKS